MTLVIPTGTVGVALSLTRGGDPTPYVITYAVDGINYLENPEDLRNLIADAVEDTLMPITSEDTTLTNIQLRYGNTGGDPLTINFPSALEGTNTQATLPQNCALLVTKVTSRPGRTGKGRFFYPSVIENEVDNLGVLVSGYHSQAQGSFQYFLEYHSAPPLSRDPAPMVLLHNEGAPGGTEPDQIQFLSVDNVIATQRGRLRK